MMDQEIDYMIACRACLRQAQGFCAEAAANAKDAPRIFTARFIEELLRLTQSVAALRAQITEGQAFVHGIDHASK